MRESAIPLRIVCIQHAPFEGPAGFARWCVDRGHALRPWRVAEGEAAPEAHTFDAIVALGGPMSVNDAPTTPWMRDEMRFIEQAIDARLPVFGICLGAQMIAGVLGAAIRRNPVKEIGWFDVERVGGADPRAPLPIRWTPFHWHGETFDLPSGAAHLARSKACEHQAFAFGERVIGVQFHPEATRDYVVALAAHEAADYCGGNCDEPLNSLNSLIMDEARFSALRWPLSVLLDAWSG